MLEKLSEEMEGIEYPNVVGEAAEAPAALRKAREEKEKAEEEQKKRRERVAREVEEARQCLGFAPEERRDSKLTTQFMYGLQDLHC